MAKYRNDLPQLSGGLFLTDGGLETWLCFQQGINLPLFAAFPLIGDEAGCQAIKSYMQTFVRVAQAHRTGFVLETPTWRASADWAGKLGIDRAELRRLNLEAVGLMAELRNENETPATPMVISGNIGPRGDGYNPAFLMTPERAADYHADQVDAFRQSTADMVTAMTITHVGEAAGIAIAARDAGMPVVISFTTEVDGRLPEGGTLGDAIKKVDDLTNGAPAYYMINCAHPTHFQDSLDDGDGWIHRVRGIRANASTKSHAELDNSTELDAGDPVELGGQYGALRARFPQFTILGGCCGTDHRHVACIGDVCRRAA